MRGFTGTLEIIAGRLALVHLNVPGLHEHEAPLPEKRRARLLRAAKTRAVPIVADWFTGHLRIATGPTLILGFHGWSDWYAAERVTSVRRGVVVRSRELDGAAMLAWWSRWNAQQVARIDGRAFDPADAPPPPEAGPNEETPPHDDESPPDYPRRA